MPLSLVIYETHNAHEARPLLATQDPDIVALVRDLILERLDENTRHTSSSCGQRHALRLMTRENCDDRT